ncbi:MAG: FG-GAP-like repeat-containing protein, partial [Phycisphaerales bacterium]|nr:FG-GAP-like repeat-containing protein [Phycisphaerales bacterium]
IVSSENSILWQNTGSYGRSTFNQYNGPITVTRSLIDSTTSTGEIINNDPFFRSVTGPDGLPRTGDEDYRLLPSSPAIDQGKNVEFDYPGETQDLDGNDRFVDDPYTDDYDSENSPNIDMGCYEYQPSSIGDNGIRRWAYEGESIVSYLNDSNWEPEDAPDLQNVTVHSTRPDTIITTTLSQDHSIQRLIVPRGYVYYALLGNTLTMTEENNTFMIGHYDTPAYFILLDGTIIADRIDMQGGISTASLGINSNSTLVADSGAIVRDRSTLYGEGTVDGDLILSGTITCDYSHVGYPNVTGNLSMNDHPVTDIDDSGTIRYYFDPYDGDANNDYDSIEVGGDVNLGGLLYLYGGGQVAENAGDQAIVIDAEGSINGEFDSVWAHYFSEDLVPVVSYVTNTNGNEQVVVDIHSVSSLLGFGDPNSTGVASQPVDAETGDIDGDTYPDLVLSIPDSDSILILFNDGVSNGEWQGFNGGSQQISVGDNPAGLTIGDFDDDGDMDIAVANTNDDTVSVLVNQDVPDFAGRGVTFNTVTHATDFYGDAEDIEALPKDVAHGNFNGDSFVDLAIANSGDAMVAVINGPVTSAGMFPSGGNYGAPGGASGIDPGDVNNDKDLDVINTTGEDGKTTVLKGNTALAGGELYDNPIVLNMGGGFGEQVITDLDGNGLDDVVTTDIASNTLNIALQRNNGTFAPPVHLPLGGSNPNSLTALDMDDDGDIDLAVVREDGDGNKVTSLYRNDTPDGSTTVYFTDIGTNEGEGLNPIMARASDVDGDGKEDLLMISENTSLTGSAYSSDTVLNDLPEDNPCPADLNSDDSVNVDDLLLLIAAWGNASGDEDINGDGTVDVNDMLLLIAAWGSCPR